MVIKVMSAVVIHRFVSGPISDLFAVNIRRGTMAKGRPKLSTTWLITSVRVGSSPIAITISAGAVVTSLRTYTGILRLTKPCMMTCPALVPTVEDESPEASSDTAKIKLAALPSRGSSVLCASCMVAMEVNP